MKKIYINESQLDVINGLENNEEDTFHEFCVSVKDLLKDLLKKPYEAKPSEIFTKRGITKDELISKMKDIGLVTSSEKINEVPKSIGEEEKLVAQHTIQYKIPKSRFNEKIKHLYKELFTESNIDKEIVNEDGAGATSCGSVMQGGGTNPSAGQYDVPFKNVQRRSFWNPSLKRNKDEKNQSISMNRE